MDHHPAEIYYGVPAPRILDAIMQDEKTRESIRGKLAEFVLTQYLQMLLNNCIIDSFENNQDETGLPDFTVEYRGQCYLVECKKIRRGKARLEGLRTVRKEAYFRKHDWLDVLAAFNKGAFLFCHASNLTPHPKYPKRLKEYQEVPPRQNDIWLPDLIPVLKEVNLPRRQVRIDPSQTSIFDNMSR